jgi:hypothetical protein
VAGFSFNEVESCEPAVWAISDVAKKKEVAKIDTVVVVVCFIFNLMSPDYAPGPKSNIGSFTDLW